MKLLQTNNGYIITNDSNFDNDIYQQLASGTLDDIKKIVFELIINTSILSTHAAIQSVNFIPANKVGLIELEENQTYRIIITYKMQHGFSSNKNLWTGGLLKIIAFVEEKLT